MAAIEGKSLEAAVAAIGDHQHRVGAAEVDPLAVRIVDLAVRRAGRGDLAEEITAHGETQQVVGAVAVADVEIAVGRERDVGRDEVDRLRRVGRILPRVAVGPDHLAGQRGLHDFAADRVAMIEQLRAGLGTDVEAVRAAAELLAERADKLARGIEDRNRLRPHARWVHGVRDVDETLPVLAQAVGVAPHQAVGREQPVVDALVGVDAGADHRQARTGFVGAADEGRRQGTEGRRGGDLLQENASGLHGVTWVGRQAGWPRREGKQARARRGWR